MIVRIGFAVALLVLAGCSSAPPPPAANADPTTEAWYGKSVEELTAMNRQARGLWDSGKADQAADIITRGETISTRLLGVPRPTLAAMGAASDLDDLYARMLLSNHNYGWARMMFQKNLARWKNWQPQTPDTANRIKAANQAIAECDRKMLE
jgi:hypothetical protein